MKTHERSDVIDALVLAKQAEPYVIELRRDFHRYPEVGLQEHRTIGVVTSELEKMGVPYEVVPNGGVIGVIEGTEPGKSLILRADLDALPMKEEEVNLKTKKLVVSETDHAAHTCGHDGHMAMLLGAAKILSENKDHIRGKVILAFEQAEEIGGGIYNLLHKLKEIGANGVWGIHLKSDIPSGKISVDPGPRMASSMYFKVKINGKSGHGSRPDLSISPLDCFTNFYQSLKNLRLSGLDPYQPITYSIGSVHAGSAPNIIPEYLEFGGSIRFLHYEQGLKMEQEFKRVLEKTCELYRCTYEFIQEPKLADTTINNQEDCSSIASESIKKSLGVNALYHYPAWMASESFGFYQKCFPGVFAFVGIANAEKGTGAEHHNIYFDIDEDALTLGVAATIQYTLDFLQSEKNINFTPESDESIEETFIKMNLSR
ncbi:amidohydrolase [Ureibacillus acetophenoni]|uniref:Amidohydrolase n=1 Tax=Ureibacillus acetophenoni TaxID=614649 RepID=A0A285UXL1_9BACL|nr:amidohydrolase [Ureibacillus acetophenoni]SOC44971.1 amidohydrolase [Ureibacillus acetophenoni]